MARKLLGMAMTLLLVAGCSSSDQPQAAKGAPKQPQVARTSAPDAPSTGGGAPTKSDDAKLDDALGAATTFGDREPSDAASPTPGTAPKIPPAAAVKEPQATTEDKASDPPEPKPTLQAAVQFAQAGDFAKAIGVLKKAREADKLDRNLLGALSQFNQMHAMQTMQDGKDAEAAPFFADSAAAARALLDEFAPLNANEGQVVSLAFYNQACVLAKTNKPDDAIKMLSDALSAGFNDLAQLDTDTDFASIRDRDEFKTLREGAEAKIAAAAKKEIAAQLTNFESFAFDFELPDLEGKATKLAEYKGKVLIVDIWGTWCPPCRQEIPHFVALHKKYQEQGFEIIGLNYENGSGDEVIKLIKNFAKDNGISYKLLIGDDDTREKVPKFEGFPTTLFIDRSGKVRLLEVGYRPLAALEAVVTTLLAEPKAADAAAATEKPADGK